MLKINSSLICKASDITLLGQKETIFTKIVTSNVLRIYMIYVGSTAIRCREPVTSVPVNGVCLPASDCSFLLQRLNTFSTWMTANSVCSGESFNNSDVEELWRQVRCLFIFILEISQQVAFKGAYVSLIIICF